MATIIQNLACLEVNLKEESGRFYFNEDILHNKEIKDIFLVCSPEDSPISSPLTGRSLAFFEYGHTQTTGLYLNLLDDAGNFVVNNFSVEPILIAEGDGGPSTIPFELDLKRKVSTQKSYISVFHPKDPFRGVFLFCVSYNSQKQKIKDFNINGGFTVEIPIPEEKSGKFDARLSDYIPRSHRNLPIKQIIVSPTLLYDGDDVPVYNSCSFLELKADNRYIEHIPTFFLSENSSTKNVFFDMLKIDYEESFLRHRGSTPIKFEKITFLY